MSDMGIVQDLRQSTGNGRVIVAFDFDGTLIVVSHDRDFLDGLVTKVYEFGNQKVTEHLCGIYEFLEKKKMDSLQELEKK